MKANRRQLFLALGVLLGGAWGSGAHAEAPAYPAKPITVVVGYPAGGDTDAMARLFAEKLQLRLGQPVIVDNRPGAGGTIGNTYVSRAAPDGYTLLFTPNPFTTAPLVMKLAPSVSYDVLNGFTPVIHSANQAVLLVASPTAGIKSVADLVAQAKAGKALSYGTPGAGSPMHIAGEWLNRDAGIQVQHVPYRGVAPSVNDVIAGHIPLAYVTLGPVAQYVSTGKLYALAISDGKRSPLLPNVPTLAELGYKDIDAGAWNGFFAPRNTPASVVNLLNANLNEILRMPDVIAKMGTYGAAPVGGPPAALAKVNAADYERLGKVIKDLSIQAE
ncbi:Bug family tripartite tricarboxylate transporter substrate binding protein [Variovorax sp. SRS16]|uniref:Bug family tripartite tricarboxylate transporter substrate binding protein n=1 Tax=Variovorax sp. SRS16 TaxID=282217 RepID=UPI0013A5A52E|nr:tripartite tricarboxylate transporter substrate binding protein [Variovorax sp. SRS16]